MTRRKAHSYDASAGVERANARMNAGEDAVPMTCGEGERLQDVPVNIVFHRLMEKTPRDNPPKVYSNALRGWTTELDAYTHGFKVFVRVLLDGTATVYLEDADGMTRIADYERAPIKRDLATGEALA